MSLLWRRRAQPGAKPLYILVAGATLWSLADGLRLHFPSYFFLDVAYVGIGVLAPAWLALCLEFTGRGNLVTRGRVIGASIVPALTVLGVATNRFHLAMWKTLSADTGEAVVYGWGYYVSCAYGYLLFLSGFILLIQYFAEPSPTSRRQIATLALAGLVPLAADVAQMLDMYPRSAPNPAPLAFGVSSALLVWGLFRMQLFELLPLVQRAAIAQLEDGLMLIEGGDRLVQMNPAAEQLLGVRAVESAGKPVADVLAKWPEIVRKVTALDSAQFEIGREGLLGRNYLEVKTGLIRDEQGRRCGRFVVLRDVTSKRSHMLERERLLGELVEANTQLKREVSERMRAEAGLRRSEEAWRSFCENSPIGIYRTTPDGRILMANPALIRLLGYEAFEQLAARNLEAGLYEPEYSRAEFKRTLERVGRISGLETQWKCRDGRKIWVRESASAVNDRNGVLTHYDGTVEDIGAVKTAEAEQKRLQEQVRESQRLEGLGVLAGGIAHDFNNMLTAMLGYADIAASELGSGSVGHEALRNIRSTSLRAADLCRQLLAYAGRGRLVIEPVSLQAIVEDAGTLLRASVSRKAFLSFESAPRMPMVMADSGQLRQVLVNLVINASESLGDGGGEIRVTMGSGRLPVETLRGCLLGERLTDGEYGWLEVSDNGCGIEPRIMAHIFEPFFTTKFAGRGLGLSAVLGIVRRHNGALRVVSEPGKGAQFRVILPVAESAPGSGSGPGGGAEAAV